MSSKHRRADLIRFLRVPEKAGTHAVGIWVNMNYPDKKMFPASFAFMADGQDIFHAMRQGMEYGFWSCVAGPPIDSWTPAGRA
ncbi:MAG: hypothetical protein AB9873_13450 [Syntrophobacteraceae bacterium]